MAGRQRAKTRAHFDALASVYDELRGPGPEGVPPPVESLVAAGDLAGRHVLDVGCGTGRTLARLAAHYGVSGCGVDPSPAMVEQARRRLPQELTATVASAESLPFPDAAFERVYMVFVVHHLARPRAFAEIGRVLVPGGRLAIATSDPDAFEGFWMVSFFPSYPAIERGRFPSAVTLFGELEAAGYVYPTCEKLAIERVFSRAQALEKLRGRAYSTFVHLDEHEYERGLERAERELPDEVRYRLELLLVTAAWRGRDSQL
jgi:ubiquinone/menaquinone biosynthesis C-methylase UbiE